MRTFRQFFFAFWCTGGILSAQCFAAVTVSVPAETIGQRGYAVQVPVSVESAPDVVGFYVELTFDNALLHYSKTEAGGLTTGWNVQASEQSGRLSIAGMSASPFSGTGDIVVLTFLVDVAAVDGQVSPLHFVEAELNDGAVLTSTEDGEIVARDRALVYIPSPVQAAPGEEVDIPVLLDNAAGVYGYYFEMSYETQYLEYVSASPASSGPGWSDFLVNATPGYIGVGALRTVSFDGADILAVIRFRVAEGVPYWTRTDLVLQYADLNDNPDLVGVEGAAMTIVPVDSLPVGSPCACGVAMLLCGFALVRGGSKARRCFEIPMKHECGGNSVPMPEVQ